MELKLFSDRVSHPCRACLLLLRSLERPFQEVKLNLLRGHHFKCQELKPWFKVPVLQVLATTTKLGCVKLMRISIRILYIDVTGFVFSSSENRVH